METRENATGSMPVKMVATFITTSFKQAAESFAENPSSEHWRMLAMMMVVLQHWKNLGIGDAREAVAEALYSRMTIGTWVRSLYDGAIKNAGVQFDIDRVSFNVPKATPQPVAKKGART